MAVGLDDEVERPRWRRWLLNRFVLTAAIILLVGAAWDGYAVTHNHGLVTGRVVDEAGRPVEGAEVTLWAFNFTTFRPDRHAATGPDGRFIITGNPSHSIQVSAEKPGVGRSRRVAIRLYFRSQDIALAAPLVLAGGG